MKQSKHKSKVLTKKRLKRGSSKVFDDTELDKVSEGKRITKLINSMPSYLTRLELELGCDPEFFFRTKNGSVIGSERVIPKQGLIASKNHSTNSVDYERTKSTYFKRDGVQVELNPRPNTCRANLANEISACFRSLKKELEALNKTNKDNNNIVEVDFSQSIQIDKKELLSLDEESRKFGCKPSLNARGSSIDISKINPEENLNRSAGGHIHISINYDPYKEFTKKLKERAEVIVLLLDMFVGNSFVLIDRDPSNIERRKLYGFAGEYRLPPHGLEYRVLSNIWLHAYPLFSLAFGLTRAVVPMGYYDNHNFLKDLTSILPLKDVEEAINNNDFDLALRNFTKLEPVISKYFLHFLNPPKFKYFVDKIDKYGLKYWWDFPDILEHWCNLPDAHYGGWGDFMEGTLTTCINKKKRPSELPKVA